MTVLSILQEKGFDVCTANVHQKIGDASKVLFERRIGAIVVISDTGSVVGVLSERDIVAGIAQNGGRALELPISDLMTSKVVTCDPEATLDHVMGLMTASRFRHVPVVENGRLRGIVSIGDVVKRRIEDTEREAQAMREYIATG